MRRSGVEQVEEAGDLVDQRVLAGRLEEGIPVAARALEQVLATGRVGEHAVHVEHDRRARLDRTVPPAPVLGVRAVNLPSALPRPDA